MVFITEFIAYVQASFPDTMDVWADKKRVHSIPVYKNVYVTTMQWQ